MEPTRTLLITLSSSRYAGRFLSVFLLPVLLVTTVWAQSGRRLPNQKSPPPASPTVKGEAEEKKPSEKKDDENKDGRGIPVLLTYSSYTLSTSHFYSTMVVGACAERLKEAGGVDVQVGGEMNRKQASDLAKNSSDTYVVLLQLENDSARSSDSDWNATGDPRYLLVSYTVFEPKTGKSKTSGRAYPRANVTDPLSLPQTRQGSEMRLKLAAEEAADRVLRFLGLSSRR